MLLNSTSNVVTNWSLALLIPIGVGCASSSEETGKTHGDPSSFEWSETEEKRIDKLWPLEAPPLDETNAVAEDEAAAHLGQFLFFDTRLSGTGEFSCATCHDPEHGFADPERLSEAAGTTGRHAPTVLNTAYNNWFFWDGRADTHWCQAVGPLEADGEQDTTRLAVVHLLTEDPDLSEAYGEVFGPVPDLSDTARFPADARPISDDPDHPENVAWEAMTDDDRATVNLVFTNAGKAIAAYERLLIRGNSPFDSFAEAIVTGTGDLDAISDSAKRGLRLFLGEGRCFACHSSPAFTNQEFHNIALPRASGIDNESLGRTAGIEELLANPFNGGGTYSDDPESVALKLDHLVDSPEQNGQFKTGSLRNLLSTPPYMHGGHFADLTEVVTHYSEMDDKPLTGHREELLYPLYWTDDQIADVVAFLETLEGEPLDASLTVQPDSPVMD